MLALTSSFRQSFAVLRQRDMLKDVDEDFPGCFKIEYQRHECWDQSSCLGSSEASEWFAM